MMETGASKVMVTSTKELIWSNKAFLAGNEVSEGHVVNRKELTKGSDREW